MWLDGEPEKPTPMKYYKFWDQGSAGPQYYSSKDILNAYWDHWSGMMKKRRRCPKLITRENCIDDWQVVNWAEEVDKAEYDAKRVSEV